MNPITVRFRKWAGPPGIDTRFLCELVRLATGRNTIIVDDPEINVDIQFESVYGEREIPRLESRIYRFLSSHTKSGIDFSKSKYVPNQQPSGKSKFKIFFTGENERPPQGDWDAYLSFDLNSYDGRNVYLPLWWITTTDVLFPTVSPWLGRSVTLDELMTNRESSWNSRPKFCIAFIGKAYPFRMHALAALSKIEKVDVFGGIARNTRQTSAVSKFEMSQDYKFVFSFENDLFPGYVTEKAPEAWATGAVPLYWGMDRENYLNPKALINADLFDSLENFVSYVSKVNGDQQLWESHANQHLLLKKPNIEKVVNLLAEKLKVLKL